MVVQDECNLYWFSMMWKINLAPSKWELQPCRIQWGLCPNTILLNLFLEKSWWGMKYSNKEDNYFMLYFLVSHFPQLLLPYYASYSPFAQLWNLTSVPIILVYHLLTPVDLQQFHCYHMSTVHFIYKFPLPLPGEWNCPWLQGPCTKPA